MRLVDTHCHLNDAKAFPNPAEAIAEAAAAAVDRLIVVGIDLEWSRRAVELAERHPSVWAVVGWHPSHAHEFRPEVQAEMEELARHPRCCAVGEIGLDFYWKDASPDQQRDVLALYMDLAERLAKPVVFHCRDAYPELLDWIAARKPSVPLLFHCFSGTQADADRAMALGCWFGVDGPVTYPKNEGLREIVRGLPRDRIVIETDAPWMAPAPHRGQRNKPAWTVHVNHGLASALGITPEECAALTTRNAEAFFGLPPAAQTAD